MYCARMTKLASFVYSLNWMIRGLTILVCPTLLQIAKGQITECASLYFNIDNIWQKELDKLYSRSESPMAWAASSMLERYGGKVVLRKSARQAATVPPWNLSAQDMIVMMIQETSRYVAPVWASAHGKVLACNMCPNKQWILNFAGGDGYNGRSYNRWDLTTPGHACHPKNCWTLFSPPSRYAWRFYDRNLWEEGMSNVVFWHCPIRDLKSSTEGPNWNTFGSKQSYRWPRRSPLKLICVVVGEIQANKRIMIVARLFLRLSSSRLTHCSVGYMFKVGSNFCYQAFILLEYIVRFLCCRAASVDELVADWPNEGACSEGGTVLLD